MALSGAAGTVALFAFLSFCVWIDHVKKKAEREAAQKEKLKALELGYPPCDADIAQAQAFASAAWAAGLIGLLVPLGVVSLTFGGTVIALLNRQPGEDPSGPLIVAWSIAAVLTLIIVLRSLGVIGQLRRATREKQPARVGRDAPPPVNSLSTAFQERHAKLED
jgi:hypothetical protein